MLFSSPIFLYLFLPLTLLFVALVPKKLKNFTLLIVSLIFYAWGGIYYVLIMLFSTFLNYYIGLKFFKYDNDEKKRKLYLIIAVFINILVLVIFKYTNFIVANLNHLLTFIHVSNIPQTHIKFPIGISFFTFHAMSYMIDVYRRTTVPQKKFSDLALYISLFPQLIAGPIIRYHDVSDQLTKRVVTIDKFKSGVQRFVLGLARKVLIANYFAVICDEIFSLPVQSLDASTAWLGIVAFTFQVYYDFGGYSDMAIGLGRMFGFEFLENFNFPYLSKSISEFWTRWHISLSNWFRDYLYIPLGGNRKSKLLTYRNLIIVFFITGFWHGASWNFVVWGLFHGFFIVIEKIFISKFLSRIPALFSNIYMLLVLMFSFAIFKCNSIAESILFMKVMLGLNNDVSLLNASSYFDFEFFLLSFIGILGSTTIFLRIQKNYQLLSLRFSNTMNSIFAYTFEVATGLFLVVLLYVSTMYLLANTYNPFIYFRF